MTGGDLMNHCICNFPNTENNLEFINNNATLDIPYYEILRILNRTKGEEILFSINYCPICGRSIKL